MNRGLTSDIGKFDGTPRLGYIIPPLPALKVEEDAEMEEASDSGRAGTEAAEWDVEHPWPGSVERADAASSRRNSMDYSKDMDLTGEHSHDQDLDNLGGHDEFVFDLPEADSNGNNSDNDVAMNSQDGENLSGGKEPGSSPSARTTTDIESDSEDESESDSDSDLENLRLYAEADEDSDYYEEADEDLEVGRWEPLEALGDALEGLAAIKLEDEIADYNHHRPDSRAASNASLDDETDADYQARMLAQVEDDAFAPADTEFRRRREESRERDDHEPQDGEDGQQSGEEQADDDESQANALEVETQRRAAAEAEERRQAEEAMAFGGDNFGGGDDQHGMDPDQLGGQRVAREGEDGDGPGDDEGASDDGGLEGAQERDVTPEAPAVEAAYEIFTAPKAERINPRELNHLTTSPPTPCPPPLRTLSRDDKVRVLMYEMAVDHALGAALIERFRWFLEQIDVVVEGIESLHMLRQHAYEISGLQIRYSDQCPGHITSANPATANWTVCPRVDPDDPDIICGATRYLPLSTPNLASLRKNSQRLGQDLPPLDKVPRDQHSHCEIGSFVDAIYANPEHSADLLRANQASIRAATSNSSRIDSFETALMPRKIFHPVTGPATANDIIISTTSDGADIYPMATPTSAVNAHLAGVRIPALRAMLHKFLYVAGVNGPVKGPLTMYMHDITADLKALEAPKDRYVAALGAVARAAGKCPSMSHSIRGVFNPGLGQWQHPLLSFRCAPEDEAHRDKRPDVWTAGQPLPIPGQLGTTFIPKIRHIRHYDSIIQKLENPLLSDTAKKLITKNSGITGRSIYAQLGIYRHVYPWMFSLDNMHVTYSNNMKHFLEAMFGKDADKPTLRGVMISPEAHAQMSEALRRTIHLQPAAHGQKVRGIEHIGRLKAAELRSFLWFHLASLMHGVYERPTDMGLVVAAIRSTRLTEHRVINLDDPYDPEFCTYHFNDRGEFPAPFANVRRAVDDYLIKRERIFVGRRYEYGGTCVASVIRAHALPDMARMWGAGLLATTQWALEGKIGDIKRNVKSRTLPVKNMENNNIDMNIMTLIRLRWDLASFETAVKANLREVHPRIADTTFLHAKTENTHLTPEEGAAVQALLARNGGLAVGTKQPTRWQRVRLANGEIIGSIGREYGTELGRIISEDDQPDDMMQKEREGIRRATRFCKVTLRAQAGIVNSTREHRIFEVQTYLSIPLAPDNRPFFVALGHTFAPSEDKYQIHETVPISARERTFGAIGIEQMRHGVGLTLGIKREDEPEPKLWVTMNVSKATEYLTTQL
ncbi:hypothetical protein P7C70_g3468, partial [Phenoliferia sp. Uapishka_3]